MRKNSRIPNFRNLGIHLRVLVWHGWLALLLYLMQPASTAINIPVWAFFPPLLLTLGCWYVLMPFIAQRSYKQGYCALIGVAFACVALSLLCWHHRVDTLSWWDCGKVVAIAVLDLLLCGYYLDLLQRAYSPAIAEARLQALQARIRPHFLFNSLNAALSLIRCQPQRAEAALQDMADLFRVLMADNRDLVPLSHEIALCQQYLNIEQLRLGDRLQCCWQISPDLPPHMLIPPLILQPLLENAVYHGIEPLAAGGSIAIDIRYAASRLEICVDNPIPTTAVSAPGNNMATKNIRERLRLHYDLEAGFSQQAEAGRYRVTLLLPVQSQGVQHV